MTLKIDPSKALEHINILLSEVNELLKIPYNKGTEKENELNIEIPNFVRNAFTDGETKLESYHDIFFDLGAQTPEEKQNNYDESLKRMKRHLVAWKGEIELTTDVKSDTNKLDKIKSQIEKTDLESSRRKKVAETKFYGAVIELLDFQRDLIKEKEEVTIAIINIQKDISEIKDILTKKEKDKRSIQTGADNW